MPAPLRSARVNVYELCGVDRRFRSEAGSDVVALSSISLEIGSAERVALIGPSGAGKTTLFRVLNGLMRPSAGEALFAGSPVTGRSNRQLRAIRSKIGTVYQADCLVAQLPVVQNVLAGLCGRQNAWQVLRSRIWPAPRDVAMARAHLARVGIPDKWLAPTHTLSGGQRQRAAIARMLMQDPPVILADEPVSALDPALAEEIVELLVGLQGDRTLVVSLHAVDLALRHFPRIVALRGGRVFFDLPAAKVTDSLLDALFSAPSPPKEPCRPPGRSAAWKPVL